MSSYYITTYTTDDGERDVLLVALPTDNDAWALVDVANDAVGLDADPHIVARRIPDLDTADQLAQEHVALSIELGRPASGHPLRDDIREITGMQLARAAHRASRPAER